MEEKYCERKDLEEKELLEEALQRLTEFFNKKGIKLTNLSNDGRTNSSKNEEEVINDIKSFEMASEWMRENNLKIGTPNLDSHNNREWYDFSIESNNTSIHNYFLPVNIKVTQLDGGAADNLNCKLGIFWTLTGCLPSTVIVNKAPLGNGVGWEKFFELVDKKMAQNKNKDYYFLVVNKGDSKDVFWTSLKTLKTISPNGSNLPFQCKWKDNRERVNRNYIEARDFILKCFKESITKRESIGEAFRKHIDKYIGLETDLVLESSDSSDLSRDKEEE